MNGGSSSALDPALEPDDGDMDLIPTIMMGTIRASALLPPYSEPCEVAPPLDS